MAEDWTRVEVLGTATEKDDVKKDSQGEEEVKDDSEILNKTYQNNEKTKTLHLTLEMKKTNL